MHNRRRYPGDAASALHVTLSRMTELTDRVDVPNGSNGDSYILEHLYVRLDLVHLLLNADDDAVLETLKSSRRSFTRSSS